MSFVLEYSGLRRGRKRVLEPARLPFASGAVVGVIGENGAGKSTLFLSLAGVLRRGSGDARIASSSGRARVCFMPQDAALPPWLTGREAIALMSGAEPDAHLAGSLLLDPLLSRAVGSLSGGELQAVALAAALGSRGDVLILDEPFAHLDFRRRLAGIELIATHAPTRMLTLISSQNAADLATFCTDYLVLAGGHAGFHGSVAELIGAVASDPAERVGALETRIVQLLEAPHADRVPS